MNLRQALPLLLCLTWLLLPAREVTAQTQPDVQNQIRVAHGLERRGDYEAALRIYRRLFNLVPTNQQYYEGVKRNLIRLRRFDQLIRIIQTQLQRSNDLRYRADLGNAYYQKGAIGEAEQIWENLLEQHAGNPGVYRLVAEAMLDNRLYDRAIEVYQRGREHLNQEHRFVFELANIYLARLDYRRATLEYLNYLEHNPRQFTYVEGRIASYTGDPDNAREVARVLESYLSRTNLDYYVQKLLANLYLRVRDFEKSFMAYQQLESMSDPLDAHNRAPGNELFNFAEMALKAGEYEYARKAYDMILNKQQDSPFRIRALYGLARASQLQGQSQEALASYNQIVEAASQTLWAQEALFQKGEIYFRDLFDLEQALVTYHDLLRRYPDSRKKLASYFRIGDCHAARGEFGEARRWYEKVLDEKEADANHRDKALYFSAYMDFVEEDIERALEELQEITAHLDHGEAVEESYKNDALELLFLIQESRSMAPEGLALFARAQGFELQRDYDEAVERLRRLLEQHPESGLVDEALMELGEIEARRGNYTLAIGFYQGLVEEYPDSPHAAEAQTRIGKLYEEGLGDLSKAREAYELVLTEHASSVFVEQVRERLRALERRQLNN